MKSEVKFDMKDLNAFVKSLSGKYQIQVGIFGNKNARKEGAETNASLGALHEYGDPSRHIPPRSFLRMPLTVKGKQIEKEAAPSGAQLIQAGKLLVFLKRIGYACQNAIQDAFDTHGFGTWKGNAPLTIKRKGYDNPLVETSQLKRSITSKVVEL